MAAELNRIVTPALAGCAVLLGVLALAQMAGLGRGHSLPTDVEAVPLAGQVDLHEVLPPLPPLEAFAAIRDRPLFNPPRRPALPEDPTPPVEDPVNGHEEPPPPLDVSITGIIITPDVRIAMVRPSGSKESVVLREGMPLPGELGAWTLSRVLPRRVLFDGGVGTEPAEIELTVDKTMRSAPAAPSGTTPVAATVTGSGEEAQASDVQSRAAEIRRRIEERRRQMREEAARLSVQEKQE